MKEYRFLRKLTEEQAIDLDLLIGWRRESKILLREEDEAVIGCIADESDMLDFLSKYPKVKCERVP